MIGRRRSNLVRWVSEANGAGNHSCCRKKLVWWRVRDLRQHKRHYAFGSGLVGRDQFFYSQHSKHMTDVNIIHNSIAARAQLIWGNDVDGTLYALQSIIFSRGCWLEKKIERHMVCVRRVIAHAMTMVTLTTTVHVNNFALSFVIDCMCDVCVATERSIVCQVWLRLMYRHNQSLCVSCVNKLMILSGRGNCHVWRMDF